MPNPDRAPWEVAGSRATQPSRASDNRQPPAQPAQAWQPLPTQGFSLFPKTRGRQIAVIAFLVVFLVVGPIIIAIVRLTAEVSEDVRQQSADETRQAQITEERARAENTLRFVATTMKASYSQGATDQQIIERFYNKSSLEKYESDQYTVEQATLTRRKGAKAYDVVLVCMPKPTAADNQQAGYFQFRWSDSETLIEWR